MGSMVSANMGSMVSAGSSPRDPAETEKHIRACIS